MSSRCLAGALALFPFLLAGCYRANEAQLKKRAAIDLSCREDDLSVSEVDDRTVAVRGCNAEAVYVESCSRMPSALSDHPNCTWILNSDTRPSRSSSPPDEPTARAHKPDMPPFPNEALGYQFGMSQEEAEAACISEEHRWTNKGSLFHCSGAPRKLGLPASTFVGFCAGKVCLIAMRAELDVADAHADKKFTKIAKALQNQYGEPKVLEARIPTDCKDRLTACTAEGRMSWRARWVWSGHRNILGRLEGKNGRVLLTLRYAAAAKGVALDTSEELEGSEEVDVTAF